MLVLALAAIAIYSYTRKVTGTSMLPTLEQGDLVVVQPTPISQITVGDIIVYDPPCSAFGESVIHRVVEVESGGLITKGDNNNYTDQAAGIARTPITQSCLQGKVTLVIPYLERLSELPYGINYIIAALIVIFVLFTELRSLTPGEARSGAQASGS